MIEKLTIQNFRCFRKIDVKNLTRVNVLVGRNGSGKTAMLEALFIGAGNPEPVFRIRAQRLGETTAVVTAENSVMTLVRQLFFRFDTQLPISIKAFGPKINRLATLTAQSTSLKYEFHSRLKVSKPQIYTIRPGDDGQLKITPTPNAEIKTSFFPASMKHNPREASTRFSELSKKNETDEFVSALKSTIPQLEDLSIEIEAGLPMIFAKIKDLSERIPMQYVSDGIYRLLSILMGVTNSQGGCVLIDELENGIYHQTFPEIVKLIYRFSLIYDVQIFLTTHSKELLEAVALVASESEKEDDYSLLRFENSEVEQFSGASFRSAVQQHIEIR